MLDPDGSAERDEDDAGISFAAASCRTRASAEETGSPGFLITPGSSCTAGPQLGFHSAPDARAFIKIDVYLLDQVTVVNRLKMFFQSSIFSKEAMHALSSEQ